MTRDVVAPIGGVEVRTPGDDERAEALIGNETEIRFVDDGTAFGPPLPPVPWHEEQ
jgi:hypothetical protein